MSDLQPRVKPKVVVFACSGFALQVIHFLFQNKQLAGVILPDPAELGAGASEVNILAAQLQQMGVDFECCCKGKLPLICQKLDEWQVNLGLIVTFPHKLPVEIITYFELGVFNLHASNLPKYPGANPIYWQIRNQETETAVVLHRAEKTVDSGNIVAERSVPIEALDTLPSLSNRLAYESSLLVADFLDALVENGKPNKDEAQARNDIDSDINLPGLYKASRPNQQDFDIDFTAMEAEEISAICRAGNGQPYGAVIYIKNVPVNVFQATPVDYQTYGTKPGTIIFIGDPEGLIVSVKEGALRLDVLGSADGVFSGLAFAERFQLDAGEQLLSASHSPLKKQA
ncbi:MAG: bifunctional polymyxin resistance protein ArnA [Pseudomonadales bacterium]|nr:bifunctional polymyxin resistance protein ArnA [Pseudomonadales bacterium]